MTAIAYGVPSSPAPVVTFARTALVGTWTGWDGSVWHITDPAQGTFLMPGVRGLDEGPHDRYSDQAPGLAGSLFNGYRATERPVFWPLAVLEESSSEAWVDRDRAFRRTLRPGKTGVWAVTTPQGFTRTLTCRRSNDNSGSQTFDYDPVQNGWATYGIYLVADEDPFWRGTPVTRTWASDGDEVDFFDPDGDPLFWISDGSTVGSASVTNPGDVDAWPVWVVNGPCDSVDLGVGDSVVEVPFEVEDGQRLVIDTNPTEQIATLGDIDPGDPFGVLSGTDVTTDLGAVDFAEIPADATTDLSIVLTGTGSVSVRIVPGYWAAW